MDNLSNVETIFFAALEKASPEDRAGYLDEACAGDQELRRYVERLLSAHPEVGSFLQLACLAGTPAEPPNAESPGTKVGSYKLLRKIGAGGMGIVYMAEQQEPIRRLVALKVIKPGLDSAEILARFEAERQALALMEHPSVAKVLDAGATESGQPYFVMELIHGIAITDYCNQRRLSPRERLELFLPVCQAIQHAHQKGIIHRDLKPSNILIALYDGRPVPKVIDFGVAKATGQKLTERTLVTGFGALVGTLEYMSPEQAELNQLDVDTRSDVYSLGVLLYELLTGATPLDRSRLGEAGVLEMLRRVREEEPQTPSNRLASSPELPALSEQRSMEPARLARLMRGELDWIVMNALEKDRNLRYATVAELAEDVQHYLRDEPVKVVPPSAGYQLRKFLKRKRGPVLAAAVVLGTLVAGVLGTTLGLIHAMQARDAAIIAVNAAEKSAEALTVANKNLQFETLRAEGARHAIQLDLALRAWERHDVAEAERVLGEVEPALQQTWEQRHLRELCHKVRRLAVQAGPHVLAVKGQSDGAVAALSADGLLIALTGVRNSFKTNIKAAPTTETTNIKAAPTTETPPWEVRVYELATGKEKLTLGTSLRDPTSLAFSPNGRRISLGASRLLEERDPATGRIRLGTTPGLQGFVEVFDAVTGRRLLSLRGKVWDNLDTVHSVSFSPDSRRIVARTMDGEISVWDADSGREEFSLQGPSGKVIRLVFSPDGRWLATLHADGGLWVWDGATGEQKFLLKQMRDLPPWDIMAFSPDGRRLALTRFGDIVHVFDVATGQRRITIAVHQAQALAFSPDGEGIVVADGIDTVRIFDAATGREKQALKGHKGPVCGVAFSGDGTRLASSDWGGTVKVWDLATGKEHSSTCGAKDVWIKALAFSPDGRRLAFCGQGVKVWDLDTDKIEAFEGVRNTPNFRHFAFRPDGKRLIALVHGPNETLLEWDLATGKFKSSLHVPVDTIALAYLADGPRLAATGADGSVYVQDAASGKRTFTLKSKVVGPVSSVAFSPDSKRVATRNGDQTVKVWNLATGREMFTLPGSLGDVYRESFSPDGIRIALVADGNGKVFDATEGRDEWRRQPDVKGRTNDETGARELFAVKNSGSSISHLAYSPDGGALVTRGEDGQVNVLGPFGGQPIGSVNENTGIVNVLFSPDGGRIAVVTAKKESGQQVRLWDRGNQMNTRMLPFPQETIVGVFFTGNTAHVLAEGPDGLRVWDEAGQARLTLQGHRDCRVAISPDGGRVAAGGQDNMLKVWDAQTGEEKLVLELPTGDSLPWLGLDGFRGPVRVCFGPEGRRLVTATPEPTIRVRNAETGQEVLALKGHKHMVLNVFWSLDGRSIVSSSMDGTIRLWDARTGQSRLCLTLYQGGGEDPGLLAISPDGGRIVALDRYTKLPTVFDAATGEVKLTLKTRPGKVRSSTFSPDGLRLVTGEDDGSLRVWDAATGEKQMVLKGHPGAVLSVAFSWDGQRIVSGASGKAEPGKPGLGELKVWDAVTGQEKLFLKGHGGPVTAVAISRDGQCIVSGSEDGTVKVWEAPAAEL